MVSASTYNWVIHRSTTGCWMERQKLNITFIHMPWSGPLWGVWKIIFTLSQMIEFCTNYDYLKKSGYTYTKRSLKSLWLMLFKILPNQSIRYGLSYAVIYLDWYFSSRGDYASHMLSNSHSCKLVEEEAVTYQTILEMMPIWFLTAIY